MILSTIAVKQISSLKQHTFIMSQFLRSGNMAGSPDLEARMGCSQITCVILVPVLPGFTSDRLCVSAHSVAVGRIWVLGSVGQSPHLLAKWASHSAAHSMSPALPQ